MTIVLTRTGDEDMYMHRGNDTEIQQAKEREPPKKIIFPAHSLELLASELCDSKFL